jgi:tetratricopeptide (TPR) repeat protein
MGKLYHNTTALYNGYFNANEIMELTTVSLEQQQQDNFAKLLPIYESLAVDNPQAAFSELDKAIKKVSTVVALHRKSQWSDDCYLLAGKAQYLKHDFESAEQTLRFLVNEYDPDKKEKLRRAKMGAKKGDPKATEKKLTKDMTPKERKRAIKQRDKDRKIKAKAAEKKRKDKNREIARKRKLRSKGKAVPKATTPATPKPGDPTKAPPTVPTPPKLTPKEEKKAAKEAAKAAEPEKPENYFMKHRPCYQEGVLWLGLTLIERDNYDGALRLLNELNQDPGTFDDIREQLAPALAHLFIKRKEFEEALQPLKVASETAEKRKDRARYAYVLAQLHQRMGQWSDAYAGFERVIQLSPSFEMDFNARLNLAQNSWLSGKGSAEAALRDLEKMLREEKNADYKDQIYYAMANIALKNNDRKQAITFLRKAARATKNNNAQLSETYYLLSQLFLESEDFVMTKNYLDSTLNILPKQDERYKPSDKLRNSLKDIAALIESINLQDSTLRLSKMSDKELKQLANKVKKKRDEERLAQLSAAAAASSSGDNAQALPVLVRSGSTPPFWAYDDREIRRGQREFTKAWGDRKLEDDWRRSNHRSSGNNDNTADVQQNVTANAGNKENNGEPDEIEATLGKIPRTDVDRKILEIKLSEAYYKLGTLYRERLENNLKAVETLELLDSKFPRSNYELNSWFYLYLAYTDLNEPAKAQVYYDKIIERHPTSDFAKALKNPNYGKEMANAKKEINTYYDEAYAAFTSGKYQEAFTKATESKLKYGAENTLAPRFALLAAISSGNIQGAEVYKSALQEVITRYPKAPEATRAREILRLVGGATANLPGDQERTNAAAAAEIPEVKFVLEESTPHYIMVLLSVDANLENSKNSISDYHRKYFSLDRLTITPVILDTEGKGNILLIRRFGDKAAAMKYYDGVQKNKADFLGSQNYQIFAISLNNYREVLTAKALGGYEAFFNTNYLK